MTDNFQFLHRTATQLLLPPHSGYYSITFLIHMDIAISMYPVIRVEFVQQH